MTAPWAAAPSVGGYAHRPIPNAARRCGVGHRCTPCSTRPGDYAQRCSGHDGEQASKGERRSVRLSGIRQDAQRRGRRSTDWVTKGRRHDERFHSDWGIGIYGWCTRIDDSAVRGGVIVTALAVEEVQRPACSGLLRAEPCGGVVVPAVPLRRPAGRRWAESPLGVRRRRSRAPDRDTHLYGGPDPHAHDREAERPGRLGYPRRQCGAVGGHNAGECAL